MKLHYQFLSVTPFLYRLFLTLAMFIIVCFTSGNTLQAQGQSKQVDFEAIKNSLHNAPNENLLSTAPTGAVISINIDGDDFDIEVWHSNILSEDFQAQFPDIKTFRFNAINDPSLVGRITLNDDWLNICLITPQGIQTISPDNLDQPNQYFLKNEKDDLQQSAGSHECRFEEEKTTEDAARQIIIQDLEDNNSQTLVPNGATLRTYNLAIVCTGEFYAANGSTIPSAVMAVATGVNNVQAIYDRDLAVRFNLLTPFVYTDAANDPFIPDNAGGCGRTSQAAHIVALNFTDPNSYDLGHVFHVFVNGSGWSGGGVAGLGAVCQNGVQDPCTQNGTTYTTGLNKGRGWSVGSEDGGLLISLTAHEIGHQFGADHTFNGTGSSCTGAISSDNAYEIGSGTSIMAYGGICQADNNVPYNGSPYFHTQSLEEMLNYITTDGNCAATTTTGNTPPTVNSNPCGNAAIIPHSTPFILTGSGADSPGDNLTYSWEQVDEDGAGTPTQGFIGATAGASVDAPLFRSYFPVSTPTRYFPALEFVNNNTALTNSFEPLPTVVRTLNFKLTVRDNNPNGGGTNGAALEVTVSNIGPLAVTSPNGGETWTAGNNVTVNWSNNTSSLSTNVNVELSIDGGNTYPYTLATNTPNNGTWTGPLPTVVYDQTTQARVRIVSSDNTCVRFYDVSNNNFTIASGCSPSASFICPITPVSFPQGDIGLDLNPTVDNIVPITQLAVNIPGSNPMGQLVNRQDQSTIVCTPNWGVETYQVFTFKVTQAGTYSFTDGDDEVMFSLFSSGGYNPASPCDNWLQANNWGGIGWVNGFSIVLNPCEVYHIVAFDAFDAGVDLIGTIDIEGPGSFYTFGGPVAPNYAQTYAAVSMANNQITAVSDVANFVALPVGDYAVYNMTYFNGAGTNPPASVPSTWETKTIAQVRTTDCVRESENSISVIVEAPLPVALRSFTAQLTEDKQTKINWITESELNNDYFEIERSLDGIHFDFLTRVRGEGTTLATQYYETWDMQPAKGANYYRLKQVDFDGRFEYSDIEVVILDSDAVSFVLFPNPASDQITIRFDANQEDGMVRLFNAIGQEVMNQRLTSGEMEQRISVAHLSKGVYYLDLVVNGKHANQKLLLY